MAKKLSPVWAFLTLLLAAMVGLAMTPLAAQQTQPDQSQSATQGQNQPITATGCLQKSASGNGYQLTDSSTMKTYDLTAASGDVDLSSHVGHTVTVTGTPSAASASNEGSNANPGSATSNPANQSSQSGQQGSSGSSQNQQLSVTNVKMVSSSCQGGLL